MKNAILLSLMVFLTACQDRSMSDLKKFVETAYQGQKVPIEPLPEIKPYEGFVYSSEDLVDPFDQENIAPKVDDDASEDAPNDDRRKELLETFPLDGLKLVGTMEREGTPWIIVKAPDGTAHRVTLGNYMGQNYGEIIDISLEEQKIELNEVVRAPTGKWINQSVYLTVDDE
ncbi:MAG: pilus assembly protein PilP [Arenicella sp.]